MFAASAQSEEVWLTLQRDSGLAITGYTGIETVVAIPETINEAPVLAIGDKAFLRKLLTSVTIPAGVTTIGQFALAYNQLTGVALPASVTVIGRYAFANNSLTEMTFPNGVTSIEDFAFYLNRLISVTIPANVAVGPKAIDNSFAAFYTENEKKAGTYTYANNRWAYNAEITLNADPD
ncbi:MAG: leucine-rich repeat domain-containing protein [Treponema sp.]|nr:leucine-rich repeat domain-containing protein [Treponema sp.]